MTASALRKFALVVSVLGGLLFFILFLASFASPAFVEQMAKEVICYRLESVTKEKIDSLNDSTLVNRAQILSRQYEDEIDQLRQQLEAKVPETVAAIMTQMRDLDCECRRNTEEWLRNAFKWRIGTLSMMTQQLNGFIQGKYMEVVAHLTKEFRIFTGSSAAAFLILLLVTLVKRKASIQLLFPVFLLLLSTVIVAYFYLFEQNWLHTILFSSYVGWSYLVYIGVIFAFLCDIVFNRARVTNVICRILGKIGTASPVPILPC